MTTIQEGVTRLHEVHHDALLHDAMDTAKVGVTLLNGNRPERRYINARERERRLPEGRLMGQYRDRPEGCYLAREGDRPPPPPAEKRCMGP